MAGFCADGSDSVLDGCNYTNEGFVFFDDRNTSPQPPLTLGAEGDVAPSLNMGWRPLPV